MHRNIFRIKSWKASHNNNILHIKTRRILYNNNILPVNNRNIKNTHFTPVSIPLHVSACQLTPIPHRSVCCRATATPFRVSCGTAATKKGGWLSPPLILYVYILSNSNMSHHSSTSLSRFNCCILSFEFVKDTILYSPSTILSQSKIIVDEVFV